MTTSKREKTFDSVAVKRRIQAEISEQIRGLTPEQEIAYFRQAAEDGPLGDSWRVLKRTRIVGEKREDAPTPNPARR
jgi:hypothetical protein